MVTTARIAGIMGAKRTADLIPMCHTLLLDRVDVAIVPNKVGAATPAAGGELKITCAARTRAGTGVEMEALTGATVAALTVYDMCKAAGHGIAIEGVRLLKKTGGKSDYDAGRTEATGPGS